jgi:hypothetical protein
MLKNSKPSGIISRHYLRKAPGSFEIRIEAGIYATLMVCLPHQTKFLKLPLIWGESFGAI